MDLKRLGNHAHTQSSSDFKVYSGDSAHISFQNFGLSNKTSFFQVEVSWEDVEALIEAFSTAGRREAVKLVQAIDLAKSIRAISENSN